MKASAAEQPLPYQPSVPCAVCAQGVDPLRAPIVLASEDGFRYLCGAVCRASYRSRSATSSRRPLSISAPADAAHGPRGEELTRVLTQDETRQIRGVAEPGRAWPVAAALAAAAVGLIPSPLGAALSAFALTCIAGLVCARADLSREESGLVAWLAAPLGVCLLALSALFSEGPAPQLLAAAVGVSGLWTREWLARRCGAPIEALLSRLRARVPPRARMSLPDASDGSTPSTRDSETASVRTGEEVVVDAGDVVPVDGVVAAGEATVIPHPSATQPVRRCAGQALLAGARVLDGSLRITASRVGDARALFRPQSFGSEGGPGSAPLTRAATRVQSPLAGCLFVACSGGLAAAFATELEQVLSGLGVALIAFPVLSIVRGVKLPFVSASALAASRGMVFRDAATLERAGRVSAAALCTDGTVTQGTCTLVEVNPLGRQQDSRELTALAMGAELSADPHPLSQAVRRYGEDRAIEPVNLRRVAYQRGRGVTALVDGGGALVLGNRHSLLASGVSVAVADREAQRAESQGRTVVFLAVGGRVRALFVFEDPVRPEARAAVQRLIDLDVEVVLLSGDHRATVESLARTVDITHVKAELTSDERASEVGRLREAGGVVAVIGHAASDELPLTAADVALTLDAAGSALEGDVAVASEDLRDAADALVIAHRARRTAQSVLAVGVVGGGALAAAGALGLLNPAVALLLSLAIDAWALPSAARLLRGADERPRVSLRGPLGWFRRT